MTPDFLDLLRALLAAEARFMIVGAYAVGVHGRPRATKDLDVWVEASSSNAPRVMAALREFGAPLMGLTEADLEQAGVGLQIGVEPGRIDVLTAISGVKFEDAWPEPARVVPADRPAPSPTGCATRAGRGCSRTSDTTGASSLSFMHWGAERYGRCSSS